ncbi:MAG: hypothetical protein HY549_02975 [Elusimicrobia bacterium]|nr:hypothetical protein [Elusimicrobiota bacterium]
MASAPEPGQGLLARQWRAASVAAFAAIGAAASLAAGIWFFPGGPVEIALRFLPEATRPRFSRIEGTLGSLVFHDLELRRLGFELQARRLSVEPDWMALAKGYPFFDSIKAIEARVKLYSVPRAQARGRKSGRAAPNLLVQRLELDSSSLALGKAEIRHISARITLAQGLAHVHSASGSLAGLLWAGNGHIQMKGDGLWRFQGHWRGLGQPGKPSSGAAGQPAAKILGAGLRGDIAARGRGHPWRGKARLKASFLSAGRLKGQAEAQADSGLVSWRLQAQAAGLSARGSGRFDPERRRVEADFQARASSHSIRRLNENWSAAIGIDAHIAGTWPRPRLRLSATGSDISFQGRPYAEKVFLTLSGDAQRHALGVGLRRPGLSLDGRGLAAIRARKDLAQTWVTRWDKLEIQHAIPWKSQGPFKTELGRRHFELTGLRLASSTAALTLDARLGPAGLERLESRADELKAAWLEEIGLRPMRLDGKLSGRLSLARRSGRLAGLAEVELLNASNRGNALGNLFGRFQLDPNLWRVEELRWQSPDGGQLIAVGTLPVPSPGTLQGGLPDFELRLRSGADGNIRLRFPLTLMTFESDLILSSRRGRLSAQGRARLDSDRLNVRRAGLRLKDVAIELQGRGESLELVQASARSGAGKIQAQGEVLISGPRLSLEGRGVSLNHPSGAQGEADLRLTVGGSWNAPNISGNVYLARAQFTPPSQEELPGSAFASRPGGQSLVHGLKSFLRPQCLV